MNEPLTCTAMEIAVLTFAFFLAGAAVALTLVVEESTPEKSQEFENVRSESEWAQAKVNEP